MKGEYGDSLIEGKQKKGWKVLRDAVSKSVEYIFRVRGTIL